ncbi:unnamed protein product [Rotaria magnacalcarata]|uniref:G-protein coupled receptors family 1 profile domain-containing protein n=1 Tax=Rotaria magnacalcarata TaxID=392030 RepID=A0A820A5H2_9BILA|nr:unnamed protein product [Rotaria magnacalcarata]
MASCIEVNLTDVDLYYVSKIQSENKNWAWWLNNLGTLVVFIIGFFGNILCLLVLCRRRLRRNSYTQYLIALAIVDTGAIFAEGMIVVALAIERVVAIKFPLWSKTICTVVNARRIILIILLFTMFIQSYHLIIKGIDCSPSVSSTRVCRCKTIRHHTYLKLDIIFTVYVWRLFLMTLLPSTMIITANILIMNKLFHEGSLVDHTNVIDNAQHKTKVLYKISRMLVIVTSIYLLLHVPGSSLDIIKYMYISVFNMCNLKWKYYIYMSHEIFDLLTNFNYGINFYLYIISGKHIRNELVRAVKHSPLRSKSSVENCNYQRSSCFMSSSMLYSRNNQARYSNVPLSEQRNDSCQTRLPLCDEHQ